LDRLHARLGQEQFDQAQAEAMALSSDEARGDPFLERDI
jgi:hypothetical protein